MAPRQAVVAQQCSANQVCRFCRYTRRWNAARVVGSGGPGQRVGNATNALATTWNAGGGVGTGTRTRAEYVRRVCERQNHTSCVQAKQNG